MLRRNWGSVEVISKSPSLEAFAWAAKERANGLKTVETARAMDSARLGLDLPRHRWPGRWLAQIALAFIIYVTTSGSRETACLVEFGKPDRSRRTQEGVRYYRSHAILARI